MPVTTQTLVCRLVDLCSTAIDLGPHRKDEDYTFAIIACALIAAVVACYAAELRWGRGASKAKETSSNSQPDLETMRVIYGFWLILGALVVTCAVLLATLAALRHEGDITHIVAVIAAVTGVIGTLTAAFFGIQQAGAGRSQAIDALIQSKTLTTKTAVTTKVEPSSGCHAGGTRVSIIGNGFTGASAVNFGATQGDNFQFVNDGLVRATTPKVPMETGSVEISVVVPGKSPNLAVGTFNYYTIAPVKGKAGDKIKIYGLGVKAAKEVRSIKFGKQAAEFQYDDKERCLLVTVPQRVNPEPDEVDVVVYYPVESTTNCTLVGMFTYTDENKTPV
jgi:hypothetical protein